MKTSLHLPIIKLPSGEPVNFGRVIRSFAGIALAFALITRKIIPADTFQLAIWIGFCLILIDTTLFRDAVKAWKSSNSESKK